MNTFEVCNTKKQAQNFHCSRYENVQVSSWVSSVICVVAKNTSQEKFSLLQIAYSHRPIEWGNKFCNYWTMFLFPTIEWIMLRNWEQAARVMHNPRNDDTRWYMMMRAQVGLQEQFWIAASRRVKCQSEASRLHRAPTWSGASSPILLLVAIKLTGRRQLITFEP